MILNYLISGWGAWTSPTIASRWMLCWSEIFPMGKWWSLATAECLPSVLLTVMAQLCSWNLLSSPRNYVGKDWDVACFLKSRAIWKRRYLSFSIYVRLWLLKGVNYSRGEATAWLQCQECNNEVTGRIDRRMFPRSTQSQLLATLWWQIAFQYWLVGWVPNWKLRQPFDMLLTLLFALPDLWSEVVTYKSSSPIPSSDVISASDYLHLN